MTTPSHRRRSHRRRRWVARGPAGLALAAALAPSARAQPPADDGARAAGFERGFQEFVHPFLTSYCTGCHGGEKPKAKLDLSTYGSAAAVAADAGHWELVLERLRSGEMPPEEADAFPGEETRHAVIDWIERLRHHEAERNAGEPGPVLARRLSNAEFDYSVLDLTGVDIRPAREFPVDPANRAGFDNSGESLAMSPALLSKYLAAARHVADHLVFRPDGLGFAPHPVVVYSDRDKYCVQRIVAFYRRQPTDFADYFLAAWRYRHRGALGMPPATTLDEVAREGEVSPKYLRTLWDLLTDVEDDAGPVAELRRRWHRLPPPDPGQDDLGTGAAREGCARMREWVGATRAGYQRPPALLSTKGLNKSSQPIVLWMNHQEAANRRLGRLPAADGTAETGRLRAAIARFCEVFPDAFFVAERGRHYVDPKKRNKGRLLSAGFHLMLGYFRDDAPLYDLVLGPEGQRELDMLWYELDFFGRAAERQFSDFIYFERAEHPGFLQSGEFAFARENAEGTAPSTVRRLAPLYLEKARAAGVGERELGVIETFFRDMSGRLQGLARDFAAAEPKQLNALWALAERAWRRPLTAAERGDLAGFYHSLREGDGLGHEEAVRDTLASVLMSPRFSYRTVTADPGAEPTALTGHELAGRLSYFLWSGLPDAELLRHAESGQLSDPAVLLPQVRRMLADPRIQRLATEFGGHWLGSRRFGSHNGVDRDRFPAFTDALRAAMYEEPVRFTTDLVQRDGSVLEFIGSGHTFVNPVLAAHYGIPVSPEVGAGGWVKVAATAQGVGRGGLLPMAVFLTQNSPGLRTSPVKRGHWVVTRLLGERIPTPPPDVPDLPDDEADLGDLSLREVLARHRENESCATCHRRFDPVGLAFEGYGPVGERRERDLGGRPVDASADFPGGRRGEGIDGLRRYLLEDRRTDFVDNLCRKLLAYALGRSLRLSDEPTLDKMRQRLAAEGYRFGGLVETVVTSPQFLRKRGLDYRSH